MTQVIINITVFLLILSCLFPIFYLVFIGSGSLIGMIELPMSTVLEVTYSSAFSNNVVANLVNESLDENGKLDYKAFFNNFMDMFYNSAPDNSVLGGAS